MPKCSYCGKMYEFHEGLTYIKTDGTIHYLCSSKCRKNMKMKRRRVQWISKMPKEKVLVEEPKAKAPETKK